MNLKIFVIQLLVFSEVYGQDCQGTFFPECQRSIRSASKEIGIIQCWGRPLYAYCKATDGTVFPIPGFNCEHSTCPDDAKGQIATGSSKGSGSSCRDDWKGDGECDDVNNNAECNYDYGDCCKKDWIGDGECDARNNFITCNNDPNNKDAGHYDGGDCRPRKCFADENDPLDIAFTAKYGTSWYDKIRGDKKLVNGRWSDLKSWRPNIGDQHGVSFHEADEQSFFPEITNRNECRALNCFLEEGQCQSDCCWVWHGSWGFEEITCDIKNAKGSAEEGRVADEFGIGCYCQVQKIFVEHECCLDYGKSCLKDLNSSQHPCNNMSLDQKQRPLLPTKDKCAWKERSCCTNGGDSDKIFDHNLPCQVYCSRTYSFFNAANRIKYSGGGRPRG